MMTLADDGKQIPFPAVAALDAAPHLTQKLLLPTQIESFSMNANVNVSNPRVNGGNINNNNNNTKPFNRFI